MYDKQTLEHARLSFLKLMQECDKKISENYIENFPVYGIRKYVLTLVIKELKTLSSINDEIAMLKYTSDLFVKLPSYIMNEDSDLAKMIQSAMNIITTDKITEILEVYK